MLGRHHRPDSRDANYPMKLVLDVWPGKWTFNPAKAPKIWKPGAILDQGQTPHCVGFATAQWAQTSPYRTKLTAKFNGDEIYADCKKVDGYPTEDGSDAHAAMKVMAAEGKVGNYFWATNPEEFAAWLSTRTSVLCGTPWHNGMFSPDAKGFVHPGGPVAGGHEYLANAFYPGVDLLSSVVGFVNSWGTGWADGGKFYMTLRDLWMLITEGGDAVAAIQKKL